MIRLFDEMRASPRMVAGAPSEGGERRPAQSFGADRADGVPGAFPVAGLATGPCSSLATNSLPGGEAMRNATVAERSFGWLWTPDKIAALQQMRRTMTRPQIAKAFGCSEKALHRTIERFKLGPVPRA